MTDMESGSQQDQNSDEVTVETTSVFRADFLNELDAPAQAGAEGAVSGVEGLPAGSALLVVKRGPNAGSRFLLDQSVTTAGRHPDSDIFLDDFTVSLRDSSGLVHTLARSPSLKVVKTDPLDAHHALLDTITDKNLHDVVAYLETLK